jgi:hypothetical protein
MMKKSIAAAVLIVFAAVSFAFAHAGEEHVYMGTVTATHDNGSFMLKKTDGEVIHVEVNAKTVYLAADNSPATAADLQAGIRAVVKIGVDGKTALNVRMAVGVRSEG